MPNDSLEDGIFAGLLIAGNVFSCSVSHVAIYMFPKGVLDGWEVSLEEDYKVLISFVAGRGFCHTVVSYDAILRVGCLECRRD